MGSGSWIVGGQSRSRSQSDRDERYKDGPGSDRPGEKFTGCRLARVIPHNDADREAASMPRRIPFMWWACSHDVRMLQDSAMMKPTIYQSGVDPSEKFRTRLGRM